MATFDVGTQDTAGVPTPATGITTIFVDNITKKLKSKDDAGVVMDYNSPGATSLAGDITGTTAASVLSDATATGKLLTGLASISGTLLATDSILQAFGKLLGKFSVSECYGTGVDGDVTLGADTTLFRDTYYNSLVVPSGINLFPNGFRVFCLNGMTVNGVVDRSGLAGSGTTAGAAQAAGTLGASAAGGAGAAAAAGTAGGAVTNSASGAGGAGGLGSGGAGGAAGASTVPTAILGGTEGLNNVRQAMVAQVLSGVSYTGGAGGGGGGGPTGGGGGGGAGLLVICARTLTGTGFIRVNGGTGASTGGVNGGGGGGGGGGTIITITENDTTATSLTFQVASGAGGPGNGTGVNGSAGSVGKVARLRS